MKYELVVGLETHAELSTKSKIFCGCTTQFGGEPNTHCCPVCIGLPGALPKLNEKVVDYAIMAGLATNCTISPLSRMDRKNYVYPDLPKAYQISQYDLPLCRDGHIKLSTGNTIRINRIHIEEDAGKLVHERGTTYVDYNRGGVPLIEIVSEPDFRSADEAREYMEKLALILKYIGVSDCKMQEGSLRCDVNISVRKPGGPFGTRTEIKNMNSLAFMVKAIEYEYERQVDILESGGKIIQETRRWNEEDKCTESMRSKEDAHDYRYFPEPDLVNIVITPEHLERLKNTIPELPDSRVERYTQQWDLPPADAALIARYKPIAEFFEAAVQGIQKPRTVSNFIVGQIFGLFATEEERAEAHIPIPPQYLSELVKLLEGGKINSNQAKDTLKKMLDTGKPHTEFLSEADLAGLDTHALEAMARQAIEQNPKISADVRSGNDKAINALIGSVMKQAKGKANPKEAEAILRKLLSE